MPTSNQYLEQIAEAYTGEAMRGTDNQLLKEIAEALGAGGAPPPPGEATDWDDLLNKPSTLAGFGITDAASDAELAAHEGDTTSVHGIANTALLLTATQINNSTLPGAFTTLGVTGQITTSIGTAAAPGVAFAGALSSGWHYTGGQGIYTSYLGTDRFLVDSEGIHTSGALGFVAAMPGSPDLYLVREAAATLQMGTDATTGTAVAQKFKGPDNSGGTGGSLTLAPGTGTVAGGALIFQTAATGTLTDRWSINSSGHLLASTDTTYDIGATAGAARPRTGYFGTSVVSGGFVSAGTYFGFSNSSGSITNGTIYGISNGVFRLSDAAGTSFDRLQFGGTTSTFPSLKRRTTALEARLADDSAITTFVGAMVLVAGAVTDTAFTNPVDGCHGYDTTNFKHYIRSGGTWKSSAAYT